MSKSHQDNGTEAKVNPREQKSFFLERQAFVVDKKAIILMMIDIAEEEYKIGIRKTPPEQRPFYTRRTTKQYCL
jgi:hypothetical protein